MSFYDMLTNAANKIISIQAKIKDFCVFCILNDSKLQYNILPVEKNDLFKRCEKTEQNMNNKHFTIYNIVNLSHNSFNRHSWVHFQNRTQSAKFSLANKTHTFEYCIYIFDSYRTTQLTGHFEERGTLCSSPSPLLPMLENIGILAHQHM